MKLIIGNTYECTVKDIKPFGAVVEFSDGYTALLHISNITGEYINNIEDHLHVGMRCNVIGIKGTKRPVEISMINVPQPEQIDFDNLEFGQLLEYYLPSNKDIYYKQDNKHKKSRR